METKYDLSLLKTINWSPILWLMEVQIGAILHPPKTLVVAYAKLPQSEFSSMVGNSSFLLQRKTERRQRYRLQPFDGEELEITQWQGSNKSEVFVKEICFFCVSFLLGENVLQKHRKETQESMGWIPRVSFLFLFSPFGLAAIFQPSARRSLKPSSLSRNLQCWHIQSVYGRAECGPLPSSSHGKVMALVFHPLANFLQNRKQCNMVFLPCESIYLHTCKLQKDICESIHWIVSSTKNDCWMQMSNTGILKLWIRTHQWVMNQFQGVTKP